MKHCHNLSISFDPLLDDFQFPEFENKRMLYVYSPKIVSNDFINWTTIVGLSIEKVLIFADPGNTEKIIHIDGVGPYAKMFGINWNLACTGVLMQWFEASGEPELHSSATPYRIYDKDNCIEIDRSTNVGPILFDTSIPHCVSNLPGEHRYGVTVRFKELLTFADSRKLVRNYIVE